MKLFPSKNQGAQSASDAHGGGILSRLAKDKRGNTLIIAGAAAVPLMMMAGAAIDYSRAVIVRSQMQDACDTTALTLRKRITANKNVMTSAMQQEAMRYYEGALGDSIQGATKKALDVNWIQQGNKSFVRIDASYTMNGTLLKIVTPDDLKISVSCEAEHNLYNYDILFVLDVTGSMNCLPDESCPSTATSGRKIDILKNVVRKFVANMAPIQTEMAKQNLTLRYAVLPFSDTVNMKNMFTKPLNQYFYITNSKNVTENYVTTEQYQAWNYYTRRYEWATRQVTRQRTVAKPGNYSLFNFSDAEIASAPNNRLEAWDLPDATDTGAPNWNGCIIERKTKTITGSNDSAGALDLDIDLVPQPGNVETFWHPYIGANTRNNSGTAINLTEYCPSPAMGLREVNQNDVAGTPNWSGSDTISRGDFNNYIDSLTATGGTMTDVGMNWAARMLSTKGIFAQSPNISPNNGIPVQKIIILITDGYMAPPPHIYTAYGYAGTPSNIAGVLRVISGSIVWNPEPVKSYDFNWRDQAYIRLGITCNELIKRNTSIWVIGFGAGMKNINENPYLSGCANPKDQVTEASTEDGLNDIMEKISGRIGGLRITK